MSICDHYDNLINAKNTEHSLMPKMALAKMFKAYANKLDQELVRLFIRTMGVYPPGAVVKLSDDSIALVVALNSKSLLKPQVLLYNPDLPKKDALIINLLVEGDLDIVETVQPQNHPTRIYEYLDIEQRLGTL